MTQTDLLLGIDGGASKTVALLAREDGKLLGRAVGAGSNPQTLGADVTIAALDQVVAALFAAVGLPIQPVAAICVGMAGTDRLDDQELIRRWAVDRGLGASALVVNDAHLVIAAGTPGDQGIGVICGTGSIAVGRAADGRMARAGGWGYLLGDEGSGYDIAVRALRVVTRAADGRGPATDLLPALLEHWGIRHPSELIPYVYALPESHAQLATLAPLVVRIAASGDVVAGEILDNAGRELADAVVAVARQLDLAPPLPLALAGGIIQNATRVRAALLTALERQGWHAGPVTLVDEPALGALRLAGELARDAAPAERS